MPNPAPMTDEPIVDAATEPSGTGRAALKVWLQLLGLLVAVALFGWVILKLTLSLR